MSFTEPNYQNFNQFIEKITKEDYIDLFLDFKVSNDPEIKITINDDLVFHNKLIEGINNSININYLPTSEQIKIKISMVNKSNRDTVVENGRIVRDKFAEIKTFKLNRIDLINDAEFLYGGYIKLVDQDNNEKKFSAGFWHNDTLILNYQLPFSLWYNKRSNKNKRIINDKTKTHQDDEAMELLWHKIDNNMQKLD